MPTPAPVIICGFGRVGQIVGRILRMHGIALHRAGARPGPGRRGAPLRQQGVFRRPDAGRRAARRRGGARRSCWWWRWTTWRRRCARWMSPSGIFPICASWPARATGGTRYLLMDRGHRRAGARHVPLQPGARAAGADRVGDRGGCRGRMPWRCSATMTRRRWPRAMRSIATRTQLIQTTRTRPRSWRACSRRTVQARADAGGTETRPPLPRLRERSASGAKPGEGGAAAPPSPASQGLRDLSRAAGEVWSGRRDSSHNQPALACAMRRM